MFAVIKTGGKQYRVAADDVLAVDKIKGDPGDTIEFGQVLVLGGDSVQLGSPAVAGASVAAEVIQQGRDEKVIAFKKRRRQNSRRKRGHRQEFTLVRITEILTDGRKPTPRSKEEVLAKPKRAQAAASGETETEGTEKPAKAKAGAKTKAGAKKASAGSKRARSSEKPAKASAKKKPSGRTPGKSRKK